MSTDTENLAPPAAPRTADGERIHAVTLTQAGLAMLRHLTTAPGWAKSPKAHRKGAKLLRALPKPEKPPKDEEAEEVWANVQVPLELTETERKTGANVIQHFSKEGAFGASEHVDRLITELGVVEE